MSAEPTMTPEPLLVVDRVSRRFVKRRDAIERFVARVGRALGASGASADEQTVHAVDAVSLEVRAGEVLGLVGESGCGKSTLGRLICGLYPPSDGEIRFDGRPVVLEPGRQPPIQMIFQDPFASLNPRMRIGDAILQAPLAHGLIRAADAQTRIGELLVKVGLDASYARRYPHQFSGGQRARIGIARALAVEPRLLVCDEAVAALDVSVQAQILNSLMELRADLGLTMVFISHDLSVVRHVSDRIAVMYLGRIVESGPVADVHDAPSHPYTQALLAEVPRIDRRARHYTPIAGEIPSPLSPPSGCHFHPRCPHAMPRCKVEVPRLRAIAPQRVAACHLDDNTQPTDPCP